MTAIDNKHKKEIDSMSVDDTEIEVKEESGNGKILKIAQATYDDFSADLLTRLKIRRKKQSAKMDFVLWTFPYGEEIAFHKLQIPIDTQEIEYKGRRYIIDHNRVKNRLGIPTYDQMVNNAQGALSFITKHIRQIDAKNYAEGVRRNWFTALWGTWKLPFIALLIAMGVALALAFVAMYFAIATRDMGAEISSLKSCLQSISCMNENIARIQLESTQVTEGTE